MVKKELLLNLRLFDGEGAPAPAAEGEAAGETEGKVSVAGRRRANNPLASVRYGIQEGEETEAAAPEEAENNTETEEAGESFDDLIKGKFKRDYEQRVQQVINRRFRETKGLETAQAKTAPIMEILAGKYGVDPSDLDGILKAVQGDDSLFEKQAMEQGYTPEQYRELSNVRQENRMLRARQEEAARRQRASEQLNAWRDECEALKTLYPNINFDEEMQNPSVTRLLSARLDFKTAFEVAHMNEIMQGTLNYAVEKTRKDTIGNIRARQSRPAEEGTGSRTSPPVRKDVSKLTKADRAEIARRAKAGQRISF